MRWEMKPESGSFGGHHDGHVEALVEQVRHAVGHGQIEGHVAVLLAVAGDGTDHVVLADAGHRMQLQLAGGTGMGIAGFGLGFLDVGEDLLAAQQVALAGLGEGDATSGTVEQAGAQVRLEVGHRPRNIGGGGVGCWDAAVKLPVSATQTKARMFCRVSIDGAS